MKRIKINPTKFVRNIFICIILLIIAAFIINTAPGYRRDDKYKDIINLIMNEENITEKLIHNIYINENGTIYMSYDDVKHIFDNNIYYDETYNEIITTSNTKVASISITEKEIIINESIQKTLDSVIRIDDNVYLPISEMGIIYNIKVDYIPTTNRVIIDDLNKGMIKATVAETTDMKFKPKRFSKKIGTLKEGEVVNCFYTTSKGWREVRTLDGTIGYIKANKLTNEYIIRQDMLERGPAIKIERASYQTKYFGTTNRMEQEQQVGINKTIDINMEVLESKEINNADCKKWLVISNKDIYNETSEKIKDYKTRKNLINDIVKQAMDDEVSGISIEFDKIENEENMIRFAIELAPRLREIGISTCIVLNDGLNKDKYINIVDYIVE